MNFSDDRNKITRNKQEMQLLIDEEEKENKKVNFSTNKDKTKIIICTRSKKVYDEIREINYVHNDTFSENIHLNGYPLSFANDKDVDDGKVEELGIWRDYNNFNNFTLYHYQYKIKTFDDVSKKLFISGIFGDELSIHIQLKLYRSKIRSAFCYGLRIIKLTKTHYDELESIQNSMISNILGSTLRSNELSKRIILGLPSIATFITKQKLKMYFKIFKLNDNMFTDIIRCNYLQFRNEYLLNNKDLSKLEQWKYPTIDFINSLKLFGLNNKYEDINNLPSTLKQWEKIIDSQYKKIYEIEYNQFINSNGKILSIIFGKKDITKYVAKKPYRSLLPFISKLYKYEYISTKDIKNSINILMNWSNLNWINKDEFVQSQNEQIVHDDDDHIDDLNVIKKCPICHEIRDDLRLHLMFHCKAFQIPENDINWNDLSDSHKMINFMEIMQIISNKISLKYEKTKHSKKDRKKNTHAL